MGTHNHTFKCIPPPTEQIMGKSDLVMNYKLLAQMPVPTVLPPVNVHFLGSQDPPLLTQLPAG